MQERFPPALQMYAAAAAHERPERRKVLSAMCRARQVRHGWRADSSSRPPDNGRSLPPVYVAADVRPSSAPAAVPTSPDAAGRLRPRSGACGRFSFSVCDMVRRLTMMLFRPLFPSRRGTAAGGTACRSPCPSILLNKARWEGMGGLGGRLTRTPFLASLRKGWALTSELRGSPSPQADNAQRSRFLSIAAQAGEQARQQGGTAGGGDVPGAFHEGQPGLCLPLRLKKRMRRGCRGPDCSGVVRVGRLLPAGRGGGRPPCRAGRRGCGRRRDRRRWRRRRGRPRPARKGCRRSGGGPSSRGLPGRRCADSARCG